jgi:beta-galactosidase
VQRKLASSLETHVLRTVTSLIGTVFLVALLGAQGNRPAPEEMSIGPARRISLNDGWRFFKGDASGAEQPAFDDLDWRRLDLPHDWAIEGPFDRKHGAHQGALPYYGTGWYRKTFTFPAAARGRRVSVEFDGAMSNARVWINGHELGGRPYGYIGFGFDLTAHLEFGREPNVLAVRLAPEDQSSRWYPGAGLYRHVWLDITAPVHVARWGTFVTTPRVTPEAAAVAVRSDVRNDDTREVSVAVESLVLDAEGKQVARTTSEAMTVAPGGEVRFEADLEIPNPQRWDLERPYRYQMVTVVRDGARELDRDVTPFGIRTTAFDKTSGFSLNGRRLKLQGVCLHHDLGALGTAVNRRAIERQLQIMKRMGANAVRTSHNPPAPELLDLTDEMGLLVIDEAFDMWGQTKIPNGHGRYFAEWGERDLRDMIRRDRNHPSIIMWSIGNEILEQASPQGGPLAKRLTDVCHEEDPTRPVTAGLNQFDNAIKNGLADAVDIPGFNYQTRHYERALKEHPNWIIYTAESASTVSSRGTYHLPIEKYGKHPSHEITSYDVIAPTWAYIPDFELATQEKLPNLLGEFVWTGFDYLGEPTPYFGWREPDDPNDWPARSSYFGIVDLAGFPKDRYYLYQSVWTREPMVHVLPHWNWADRAGQPIPVVAYTNADEVELFLNGTSHGRTKRGTEPMVLPVGTSVNEEGAFASKYRLLWQVPYQPGTLRAVAYRSGKEVASQEVRTAGPPARVTLHPDRSTIHAGGQDLSFVTVRIEDANGTVCPLANNLVRFSLSGPGSIAGVDNGNPATFDPFQGDHRQAFNGLALLIVRSARGASGEIRIEATSDGLAAAKMRIVTK